MNTSIYLQLISLNKTYNNHFLKRYVKLVSFFKERNFKKKKFLHHEHHIVPESFGGPDTVENLVFITIREHFILHWMLYKAFPKSGMVNAFHIMCHCSGQKISSKVHEKLKIEFAERQSENTKKRNDESGNPFQRRPNGTSVTFDKVVDGTHPWQDKEKARERANKRVAEGRHNFQDKEKARENNLKRVAEGRHHFSGPENNRKRLEDGIHNLQGENNPSHKRVAEGNHNFQGENNPVHKQLKNGTHNSQIKIECPHCKRIIDKLNFSRWHGDKCKLKP